MPIRFKGQATPPSAYQVLEFKLNAPHFIIVGDDESAQVVKDLHWLPSQNRTVPCLEEDCPWCHLPIREVLFRPCLYAVGRNWKIGVMPFLQKMRPFLEIDFKGKVFKFERLKVFNGPVGWKFMETMRPSTMPVPSIDVKPSLLRMWGQYTNYKIPTEKPMPELYNELDIAQEGEVA